jgi:hypothetical protein
VRLPLRLLAIATVALVPAVAGSAQFQRIGALEVHYVVVNTLFLEPDVAARYGIVRARDRAILNVSVVGPEGRPIDAAVSGRARNLLGHDQALAFERIAEGEAIYFIAPIRHTDQDVLRFDVAIDDGRGNSGHVEFMERLWVQPE